MKFEDMAMAQTIEDIPEVLRLANALVKFLEDRPDRDQLVTPRELAVTLQDVALRLNRHLEVIAPKKGAKKPRTSFEDKVLLAMCEYPLVEDMRHAEEIYKRHRRNVRRKFQKMIDPKAFAHSLVVFEDLHQKGAKRG